MGLPNDTNKAFRAGFGKKDRLLSENSALIDAVTIR
jgi:hypothetical protein